MIPNKLYIPTTTLNFNNIMASESISPAEFYSMRNFGYKRFDKVKPNNLEKRIILYDKYPDFDINDIELENYPLVIEVTPQYMGEDIIHEYKNGVFYAEETIYLNPFSTKIYFRSKDEKRRTLSKVEQSLNTKMVSIYQNCILVKSSDINSFEWKNIDITDSTSDFSKYISKDRRINKLKGFLYAYLFGANKSLSPEVVALKKYAKDLQNLLSAIITNPDGYANYKQEEELKLLYQKINDAFYQVEGRGEILLNRIKQKEIEYNCSNFADILKREDLYNTWFQKQNLRPSYQINPFNLSFSYKNSPNKKDSEYNNSKAEEDLRYFDTYFAELDNAIGKHIKSTNTNIDHLPILQHCNRVERIPSDKTGFQVKLFNEYKEEHWNREEFLASRLDFATAGGKLFKEELQDNWENSPSKAYINDLRKNLASHTPFALNSVQNLTLQSFAVFCQKGEEDINKLEDYLITNEIGDFRIAFALWGIVFGFANMPKTLTNDLFLSNDLEYVSEIYKYIFKQIHGIELEGKFERKLEKEKNVSVPPILDEKFFEKLSKDRKNGTIIKQSATEIEIEFRKKLEQVPKITKSQVDFVLNECKKVHFLINENLFNSISNFDKLGKRTNAFKAIKECLQPNPQGKTIPKKDPTLFSPQQDKELYLDESVFDRIKSLLSTEKKERNEVKIELDWIQKVHKNGGYPKKSGDWVKLDDHSNQAVIKHFENNAKGRIESSLLTKITERLKELYL